jgi:hypothetical protein
MRQQYMIAPKGARSLEELKALLGDDPEIEILQRQDVPFSKFLLVRMSAERAERLQQMYEDQLIIEPDQSLKY